MTSDSKSPARAIIREPLYDGPLDPKRIRLIRDKTGRLRMTVEADRSFLDVKLAYAFPMTDPDHFIGVLDDKDRCIGMLDSLDGLDEVSLNLAREALRQRYFIPDILHIRVLREEFGVVYFDVETDHGPRAFCVRGLRDSIEIFDNGRILIADTDGNRYNIPSWQSLDAQSRRLIESFV